MPTQDLPHLAPGQLFHGRYEVVRCIRAGGMGAVYEVVHLETRRRRALKVMLPAIVADAEMRGRFKLEATVAADIESEHIVEIFDAGVDADTGSPFLVMELLRGEDLAAAVEKRGALPAVEVVQLLSQAAMALDKTHAAGVVHRDLKPENLFVTARDDGSPRLKILDFGIAKVVSQSAQTGSQTRTIGTPLYMSPEQIMGDGRIGPRVDLYALGHIAYALLAGRPYWSEEASVAPAVYALLMKVTLGAKEAPSARADRLGVSLPAGFDAWFARATAIDPKDRHESAGQLVAELASAVRVSMPRLSVPEVLGLEGTQKLPRVDAPARIARTASGLGLEPTRPSSPGDAPPATGPGGTVPALFGLERRPAPGAGTTAPVFSDSEPPPSPPKRSQRAPAILGVVVMSGLIGLAAWTLRRSGGAADAVAVGGAGSPATAAASSTATEKKVEGAPSLSAAAPGGSASGAPVASTRTEPARAAHAGSAKPITSPAGGSKPTAPSCNPPYTVDSTGSKHAKPECL